MQSGRSVLEKYVVGAITLANVRNQFEYKTVDDAAMCKGKDTMAQTNETDSADHAYTMGYGEEFQRLLRRRSAELNSSHLLPHLRPGMRLLDVGCGPGTISLGLARAVEPGDLHGIDIEESQIEIARNAATAGGHGNAHFRVGDATCLPFEDSSFDVVHSHALLMHVPGTSSVLAEMMRVLKPDGLISARDMIGASCFIQPPLGDMAAAWQTFTNLIEANGGQPDMGKHLKWHLREAGFEDICASASFESFSSAEDIAFFHGLATGWFLAPDTVAATCKAGLATREQFDEWRRNLDAWRCAPDALSALAWGEVVGRKPDKSGS